MGFRHKITALLAVMILLSVLAIDVAPAGAAHHLVRIRQVFPGSTATPNAEFVVLQLTGAGENQFTFAGGSSVRLYDGSGAETNSQAFASSAPNGENQRTVLVATSAAATTFSVTPDLQFANNTDSLSNAGGAACFTSVYFGGLDCVGWGTLAFASPPSPIGTAEAAIPADNMLERSIAANCATLFETLDDTNNSDADFSPVAISAGSFTPRTNSSPILEMACSPGGGGITYPPPSGGASTPAPVPPKKKCKKKKRSATAQVAKKKCKKKR